MDVFTTYWQRLTRIVGWDDAGIFGGRGGMEKLVISSDIADFTYFLLMDHKHVTYLFIWTILNFFLVISVENALYIWRTVCARASHISRYASHF